jgi:hypothetical protein
MGTFGEKSFAVMFVVLLGVPALPVPTGGATHVLEAVAMVLALQLLVGRDALWLPRRWRELQLVGDRRQRFIKRLIKMIRWLENRSRPRGRFFFSGRPSKVVFGALVMAGSLAAFVAPPFSGLDTLRAMGVVLLSVGVLLEDVVVVIVGLLVGAGGVVLVVALGRATLRAIQELAFAAAMVRPRQGLGHSDGGRAL